VREDASHLLPVAAGGDLDALLLLRAFACGRGSVAGGSTTAAGGVPVDILRPAGEALRRARYAAIVWDASATRGPEGAAIVSALALLSRDLNAQGRAAARPLGAGGNVAGVTSAILSQCGFPRAVGFAGGSPREAPEVFGAAPMLQGDADALLLIGAWSVAHPGRASVKEHGAVVIGPRLPEGCARPEVFIPTAVPALSETGVWLRADGVPVPMRAPVPAARPTEGDVLDRLLAHLEAARKAPSAPASGSRRRAGSRKKKD
jgi:formylmethanofuran dehydrogenase subunit B